MKKSLNHILLIILCAVVTISCTEKIDLVSEGMEAQLVITGTLSTEAGVQTITIAETVPYFGSVLPENIDAAKVCLDGAELKRISKGVYGTEKNFYAQSGHTYTLEVWIDYDKDGEDERYWATTTVPESIFLESLSLESALPASTPNIPFLLVVGFMDVLGKDYYGAKLYINGSLYSNRILRYYVHTMGNYSQDGEYMHFPISDWILLKSLTWDNGAVWDLYAGDELTVELNALSPEYHKYLTDAKTEKNQQFPLFSGPRGNVVGNIQGGALGIFGSYTVSRRSVTLPVCDGLPARE